MTDATFELEAQEPGSVPQRVIDELVQARTTAQDYAQAFADAVRDQAEKFGIEPKALRTYVCAVASDNLEKVDAEVDDLAKLLERAA